MVDWTDDRIAALSDQDLKDLLVNAERKDATEIILRCQAELEKRNAAKPRKAAKPRTEIKEFEHEVSAQLAAVGKEMAEKYDLSEKTLKNRIRPTCEGLWRPRASSIPAPSRSTAASSPNARSPSNGISPIAAARTPCTSASF